MTSKTRVIHLKPAFAMALFALAAACGGAEQGAASGGVDMGGPNAGDSSGGGKDGKGGKDGGTGGAGGKDGGTGGAAVPSAGGTRATGGGGGVTGGGSGGGAAGGLSLPEADAGGRGGAAGRADAARDAGGAATGGAGGAGPGGADAGVGMGTGGAGGAGAGSPAACGSGVRCRDIMAGALGGRAYAPAAGAAGAPWPLIVLLPGGGAGIDSVEWAALRLARAGYVVSTVKPANATPLGYSDAAKIEVDFMLSPGNPFSAETDGERVGAAGWSLGARALTKNQAEDPRIDAIVAWDNLATSEAGDAGSPSVCQTGRLLTGTQRSPRVPALGQASDQCATTQPRESKKTAYGVWRAAGVPAMEVVFAGSSHFFWSSTSQSTTHELAHHYTLAWFDRWVKGDRAATARLLARTNVAGKVLADVLSTRFASAAFLDGHDCADLRDICN